MNIELFFKVRFLKVAFVGGNSCLHQRLAFFPTLKGDSGVIWWVSAINSNNNNSYCSKNPVKQTLFLPHCADEGMKTQCLRDLPRSRSWSTAEPEFRVRLSLLRKLSLVTAASCAASGSHFLGE